MEHKDSNSSHSSSKANSVRALAALLGLSRTTVSDALMGSSNVSKQTQERVKQAALDAGYHYNPLAGSLMSELRRSSFGRFQGTIAVVDLENNETRSQYARAFHNEIIRGAELAAGAVGFNTNLISLLADRMPIRRLGEILNSRGIRGLLILPAEEIADMSAIDWGGFAAIYTDSIIEKPALDCVCPDHFRSMWMALGKLEGMGYSRMGFVKQIGEDKRLSYRYEGAFRAFLEHHPDLAKVPPHLVRSLEREAFLKWFDLHRPDVVLCHKPEVMGWLEAAGFPVPRQVGFCCLNVIGLDPSFSGLDLQPSLIGSRAMDALVGQLFRRVYGVPQVATFLTVPAAWNAGATLLPQECES